MNDILFAAVVWLLVFVYGGLTVFGMLRWLGIIKSTEHDD